MTEKKLSRRDAMKVLGAAIGGAALSTIPPKWSKPALAASQLPEHARQSLAAALNSIVFVAFDGTNQCQGSGVCMARVLDLSQNPAVGIPMSYTITSTALTIDTVDGNPVGPIPVTGQKITDIAGEVSIVIGFSGIQNTSSVHVVWGFVNDPADGSGTTGATLSGFDNCLK